MKKVLIHIFIFLLLGSTSQAQDTYSKIFDLYGNTLEYGNSSDIIFGLVNAEEAMYTGIGNRCDDFTIDCAVIAELSMAGDTIWTKVIEWLDPGARGLDKKEDMLLMAGHDATNFDKFFLYQMTLSGDSIQNIELYPPEGYHNVLIGGVFQYGEYSIVYGTAREEGASGYVSLAHWVTSEGVIDTTMIFDDGDISDNIWDIDQDPAGNLVLLLHKEDIVPGPFPYEIFRKQLLKFNYDQELIWEWETDNDNGISGYTVGRLEILENGNIILASDGGTEFDEEIWAINDTGFAWKYTYPASNTLTMNIANITETINGDIIGCGRIKDNTISGGRMGYLFRMSAAGDMLWERAIVDSNNEVPGWDILARLRDIVELADGTILAGGWINTWFYNDNNEETLGKDAWLVRTDADGCIVEDCEYIQDFTTSIPVFSDPIHLDIYPNPTSDFLTISWPTDFPINEIQVYDPVGRLLLRATNPQAHKQLDLSRLVSGLYAVVLLDDQGRRYSENVLVQR